ncbi:DUF2493 domain-containing protein [Sphingosinicella microcystinivorans]|uniref:DUF2493 domain-containing protein n=1 Tax=Sphingosinicella microcystinivorans TaxID=335406 RepID=UPI0022F3EA3F|nr:DUF2493 domain-containing protein [Sphingosinicella microcystinivorans]WBX84449.1 DUF2493 domain-containing protein [Sphingosinicella microcystinivorans]
MSKTTASRFVSSFSELPKLFAPFAAGQSDQHDEGEPMDAEIAYMRDEGSTSQITRGDVQEHYAALTEADAFEASFGDPVPLSIGEREAEPGEEDLPHPLAAQGECSGIVKTIFDLLTNTRLEPQAREIAWGIVNSFHFVAGTLEREEDAIANKIRDMARITKADEIATKELEDAQRQCEERTERRKEVEAMREYAAAAYRACCGQVWRPPRGSRVSHVTGASQIRAADFLRARAMEWSDRHNPKGPVVVVSGPAVWHDWLLIYNRLDEIHARIPNMVLFTTGQDTGVDLSAAAWAESRRVPHVGFDLRGNRYGTGKNKGFRRNKHMNSFKPVEAILCEGSGIQDDLYDLFNPPSGRRVPTHLFYVRDQAPMPPIRRLGRRRTA